MSKTSSTIEDLGKKCLVCNLQESRKYDHYGCKGVCSSCRNFFRRSVHTKQSSEFKCKIRFENGGNIAACVIDSKNRRSCKKCRFEKCLSSGMKPNWVTNEIGAGKPKPMKLQMPEQNLQPVNNLVLQFTNEEMSYVSNLYQIFNETTCSQYYLLYSHDPHILQAWLRTSFQGNIIPFEIIQKMEWSDNITLIEIGIRLLSREDITDYENVILVQRNVPKITAFLWVVATEFEDVADFFKQFIEFGLQHPESVGVATILPVLQQIQLSHVSKYDGYSNVFSSPWAPHIEIEERHLQITRAIDRWYRPGKDQHRDRIQSVLLSIIILLSAEDETGFDGQQKAKIERLQMKYILMYQRYLKSLYPYEANAKFAGGLMLLHYSKELCEMHSLRLPI